MWAIHHNKLIEYSNDKSLGRESTAHLPAFLALDGLTRHVNQAEERHSYKQFPMKQGCRLGCLGNMPITSDYNSTREGRQVVRLNRIFSEHVLTPAAIPAVHVLFLLFLFTRENGSGNSSNSMQFQDSRARIASQLKEHRRYKLYPSKSRCLVAEPPRFKKGNTEFTEYMKLFLLLSKGTTGLSFCRQSSCKEGVSSRRASQLQTVPYEAEVP